MVPFGWAIPRLIQETKITLLCFLFFRQNPNLDPAVFVDFMVGKVFSPVAIAACPCYIRTTLEIKAYMDICLCTNVCPCFLVFAVNALEQF